MSLALWFVVTVHNKHVKTLGVIGVTQAYYNIAAF